MISFVWILLLLLASTNQARPSSSFDHHSPVESTKQFYNSHVDEYISNVQKAGLTHVPQEHLERFVQLVPVRGRNLQHAKILEIGCGYGRDAEYFCKTLGMNVIGTDYSRSMLLKAQELCPEVHFMELDMRRIGHHFLPNSLDGIWASATIIHIPKEDVTTLFQGLYDILRPGGAIYVSVKQGTGETFVADQRYGGIRKFYAFYEEHELLEYMSAAGFEIVESGVADHRETDSYATHPFIHVFATKPENG
jgi:SAM-dependent methyltransferase